MKRWAVIGTGGMASQFVQDARHGHDGRFVAVHSRTLDKAEAFRQEHGLELAFDDLDAMLASPDIDIVYVASPHTGHAGQAIAALEAGKPVLIEKPVAVNLSEAEHIYETARRCGVFCQEAVWTRFNPVYQQVLNEARDGRLGALKHAYANFGFTAPRDPKHRLINPDLAGGALLDIGLYPLLLPLDLFGDPDAIEGRVAFASTGVDLSADLVLEYDYGHRATVSYSLGNVFPNTATISGDGGWVELQSPWFAPNAARWKCGGAPVSLEHYPLVGTGYHYEFTAVNRYVEMGAVQSEEHSWDDSLRLMRLLDRIRHHWGPIYPFETR